MTPFLATITERGSELVRRLREAKKREDMEALIRQMTADFAAELAGRTQYSAADQFAFFFAMGQRPDGLPRARAASYDAAGMAAMAARAYREALFVLGKAEELVRSKERQERIRRIRALLVARGELPAPPPVEAPKPGRRRQSPVSK